MSRRLRTFLALDIPDEVRNVVATVQERLAHTGTTMRAVHPASLHLTVRFIGDWEENRLAELCAAVSRATAGVAPFAVRFAGLGAFPNPARPRVIFLDCQGDPPDAFARLHQAVEAELEGLGLPRDSRGFRPHLTLARVKGPPSSDLPEVLGRFADFEAGEGWAEDLGVYLSELTSRGPIHTRAGTAVLEGEGA